MALAERRVPDPRQRLLTPPSTGEVFIGSRPPINSRDINRKCLMGLINDYTAETEGLGCEQRSGKGIIGDFKDSNSFEIAYSMATNRLERFKTSDEFRQWLSGHLFSHLAFWEISRNTPPNSVLLPEAETMEVFRQTSSTRIVLDNRQLPVGDREYIPDGILVANLDSNPRISKFYEFTLSRDPVKFSRQLNGYLFAKRRLNGLTADDSELVFVVPSVETDRLEQLKQEISRNRIPANVRMLSLPVTHSEFGSFVNRVLDHRSPKVDSLREKIAERQRILKIPVSRRNRADELRRRMEQFQKDGDPESSNYIQRHRFKRSTPYRGDPRFLFGKPGILRRQ